MSVTRAFVVGLGRAAGAPFVVVVLFVANFLIALPFAALMYGLLRDDIGASLVHEELRTGFSTDWYDEFSHRNDSELAQSFGPHVIGQLPLLTNLESLLDGDLLSAGTVPVAAAGGFLLVWAFFSGGLVDRFANRPRIDARQRFFVQSCEYFLRFVRLFALSLGIYLLLFHWLADPLHEWLVQATRDVTRERTILLLTMALYGLIGFLLFVLKVALDYAKIVLVSESRRSAFLAWTRGLWFVLRHPVKTLGLGALLLAMGGLVLTAYALVAPGATQSTPLSVVLAFLVGQVYLVLRVGVGVWGLASQTELYRQARSRAGLP